jgi:hypothetical protein
MPLNAGYTDGRRYCEHCGQELEHTPTAGKVVLTFGDFPLTTEGRVFLLANPDFEHVTHHIEISRVYLDTATTDLLVFERFITYILNCPPTLGIHSVKVFYRGSLDALGAHLHNVLQNTFASLQPLPSTPQQSPVTVTQEPNALWLQPRNVWERFLASLKSCRHPVLLLLQHRELFWDRVKSARSLAPVIFSLIPFIVFSCAVYGAVLAGWRSPALSLYVAIKFPILLVGTTGVVAMLNWMLASAFGSGLTFPQVTAITYGAMTVSSWIFLGSAPVTFFFTTYASSATGTHAEIQRTHNYLLLMHILLIAMAGIAGNSALRKGLRRLVAPGCALRRLYWSWLGAFALVGCQLSWILRPFVGSPFYPVVFMRPDCLERNFYEFIFGEVLPYIIKGG